MDLFDIVLIGILICGAIATVFLGFDIFSKRYKSRYDERQTVEHGKIAMHTLIFTIILAAISCMLYVILDPYMSLYSQNMIIFNLVAAYYLGEQTFRGILFPVNWTVRRVWMFALMGITYVAMAALNTIEAVSEGYIIFDEDGNFGIGAININLWFVVLICALCVVGWYFQGNKKTKK